MKMSFKWGVLLKGILSMKYDIVPPNYYYIY